MKKHYLLKTMLLLCALVVGSSSVWATETLVYTLSFTQLTSSDPYNNYTKVHETTSSGITWNVYGNQSIGAYLRVGGKNTTDTDRTLTSTAVLSSTKAIGKVVINHSGTGAGSNTTITVNSITVEGSTSSSFASSVKSKTISSPSVSSAGALEFTLDDGNWDANCYFRVTMNYKVTKGSGSGGPNNSYLTINNVKFYEAETGAATTVTISDAGLINTDMNSSTVGGKLTASIKDNTDAPVSGVISWSSNNRVVAKVGSDGSITLAGVGTATITATYAGDPGNYKSSYETYDITVTDSNLDPNDGSAEKPYTIAQAIAAYDAQSPKSDMTNVYVTGIVSGYLNDNDTPSNGQLSYWISADGSGNDFEIYNGKYIGGVNFTASPDNRVKVGDKVVVKGTLTYYAGGSVYELKSTPTLISKEALTLAKEVGADGWATYITTADVEFEPENAFVVSSAGASVTLKSVTQVPSGTPLVLKGEGKKWVTVLGSAPDAPTNSLAISDGAGAGTDDDYVLGKKNGVAGFYKWNGGNLSANKVYLPATAVSSGAHEYLGFDIDASNGVTLINEVKGQKTEANSEYYNLTGQMVLNPTKGLYIVNGKKIVIK